MLAEQVHDLQQASMHRDLMYAALRLKDEHDSAVKGLEFTGSEIASPPDYEEYYADKGICFSTQGLAALRLIRSLEDHYAVPTSDRRGYDPRHTFTRMIEVREKRDAEREALRRELEKMARAAAFPFSRV